MSLPPIFRLPREVLEEIADCADIDTQLSLSRISKDFNWWTTPSLYRVIWLKSPSKVVACCQTLAHNRTAAVSVRRFTIQYTPPIQPVVHYFASFYAIIQHALACMFHLQELNLLVPDHRYAQLLGRINFHSLSRFECYLPLTDALTLFLNHHPTIVYLQVAPSETTSLAPSSPIVLPKLQYFIGNSECISALVPNASLRAAFLVWETADATPLETIIRSLEQSSGTTINLVSCRRSGLNLDLIDLISTWLPDIYVLIITNLIDFTLRPNNTYLSVIANNLSRFTMLRHVHIHCVAVDELPSNLDEDYTTATLWGTECPSLIQCIIPWGRGGFLDSNGMKWIRFRKYGIWVPGAGDPQGSDWTWKMLHTNEQQSAWGRLREAIAQKSGLTTTLHDTQYVAETLDTLQLLIEQYDE